MFKSRIETIYFDSSSKTGMLVSVTKNVIKEEKHKKWNFISLAIYYEFCIVKNSRSIYLKIWISLAGSDLHDCVFTFVP